MKQPTLHVPPDLDLHYEVDDFTDPWTAPETILLLHGNAESGAATDAGTGFHAEARNPRSRGGLTA